MKPRRVFVTLELETTLILSKLRRAWLWHSDDLSIRCLQASANVARAEGPNRRTRQAARAPARALKPSKASRKGKSRRRTKRST